MLNIGLHLYPHSKIKNLVRDRKQVWPHLYQLLNLPVCSLVDFHKCCQELIEECARSPAESPVIQLHV